MPERYVIALGSNQPHQKFGRPAETLRAVVRELSVPPFTLCAMGPIIHSRPIGPSQREYANGAVMVATSLSPPKLLEVLKGMERAFGRRAGGQRWRARVLDLDIILWSGGVFASDDLVIPHMEFRSRPFVLEPVAHIAAGWRDPVSGLHVRHLKARLDRRRIRP